MMEEDLTVGSLIDKLNFALENGYLTKEHSVFIGGSGDTCLIRNISLPAVILNPNKEFKKVEMIFTKL